MRDTGRRWSRTPLLACLCGLLVACTGGGASTTTTVATSTTSPPTDTVPSASSTSTPKKADGLPIVIGITYNPTVAIAGEAGFSDVLNAAAVQINEFHGGINGRPIHLVACSSETDNDGRKCAAELTNAHVELVVGGEQSHIEFGAFRSKRIPVFATRPRIASDGKLFGVSFFSGGQVSEFETMLWYTVHSATVRAKSIGIVAPRGRFSAADVADLTGRLAAVGVHLTLAEGPTSPSSPELETLYEKLLAPRAAIVTTTSSTGVPLTTTSPEVASASTTAPGATSTSTSVSTATVPIDSVLFLYDEVPETCVNAIRARSALAIQTPFVAYSRCADSTVTSRVTDDAQGWTFVGGYDRSTVSFKQIVSAVGDYTNGLPGTVSVPDDAALAYSILMTLVDVGNNAATDGSLGVAIASRLTSTPQRLWDGTAIECGQSPDSVAICVFGNLVRSYLPNGGGLSAPAEGGPIVGALPIK